MLSHPLYIMQERRFSARRIMTAHHKCPGIGLLLILSIVAAALIIAAQLATPSLIHGLHRTEFEDDAHVPTAVTLHYPTKDMYYDTMYILHNCILARRVNHPMVVFTQNTSLSYCRACQCRLFKPLHCPSANPREKVNHCEKLGLISRLVPQLGELIYLDADLTVIKPSLFAMLTKRSRNWDFLASYGEGEPKIQQYKGYFNSGLFYMRYLPTANYSDMLPFMYRLGSVHDQSILSLFVHENYRNWDTLTRKWHCRRIFRFKMDTPPETCLTVHDRPELPVISKHINFTLLNESGLE